MQLGKKKRLGGGSMMQSRRGILEEKQNINKYANYLLMFRREQNIWWLRTQYEGENYLKLNQSEAPFET